jgi:hypothetical protein
MGDAGCFVAGEYYWMGGGVGMRIPAIMNKKNKLLFTFLLFCCVAFAQPTILDQLKSLEGITIEKRDNLEFKEYYEIMVDQPVDHFNSNGKIFKQHIVIGINNVLAPTVMEVEGYAIGRTYKPDFIKDCNFICVEHRYYGTSSPDTMDWKYLTIKQASYDLHSIRKLFGEILKGKWMTTGISKGGQTAIAYKMYFPDDADATVAYVTPIKNGVNDSRFAEYMHTISKTECGRQVFSFQRFAFRNKASLLTEFNKYVNAKGFTFGTLTNEKAFEYVLLEYPFSFFQNCYDCKKIPDTTSSTDELLKGILKVVYLPYFTEQYKSAKPSLYMFYHELGYYEYDITGVKQWLSGDNYSNSIFAPQDVVINFDATYQTDLNKFITDPKTERLVFIYGELDPYTVTQAPVDKNKNCLKFIVKNGCHKSRISDLPENEQQIIYKQLSVWLQWKVGN